jgi:hypothetical protein
MFNPSKRVILLGDLGNRYYTEFGIEHHLFDDYQEGEELKTFMEVYQFVAGTTHKKEFWTNFVFKRWFLMYNFLKAHQIEQFWTMDSDNLILTDLAKQEWKFDKYDGTTQCNGMCLNGYVSNLKIVEDYLNYTNYLFQNEEFLATERERLRKYPHYAFTEMMAFEEFEKARKPKILVLNSIIDDESFDQCLASLDDMEAYSEKLGALRLKKLFFASDGTILCFHPSSKKLIKLNTINMSWLPEYLYKRIYNQALILHKNKPQNPASAYSKSNLKVLSIAPPPILAFRQKMYQYKTRLRNILKK